MLVTVSYSPKKLNSLFIGSTVDGKTDFENSKYAPLQSQETAMRYALASILSNVNGYNIIADVYNQLYADVYNKDSDDQNKAIRLAYAFQNLVQLTGYPGTGKSTILDTISRCLENAGVKIGAYAPSVDQGSNLIGILGERDNLVNKAENSTIDDLMGKVIGEELYNKMYKEVESKECVHLKQDIEGRLKPESGQDGDEWENECNATAATMMRKFSRENPEIFE
jgi:hypothetical protein